MYNKSSIDYAQRQMGNYVLCLARSVDTQYLLYGYMINVHELC